MNNFRIPIVFSTDENYVYPTSVTIVSILESAQQNVMHTVYILYADQMSKKSKQIFNYLETKYCNLEIIFIKIDETLFENAVSHMNYITIPTFYRLIISEVLKNEKKCIFMDGDIVVNTNLLEMFQIEMSTDYLVGIRDYDRNIENDKNEEHRKLLGLDSMKDFIYGAPFIMNLEAIRKEHIIYKFYEHMKQAYPLADQDILNVCCYGRIKFLPLNYNVLPRFLYREDFLDTQNLTDELIKDVCYSPKIVHFAGGKVKPWSNTRCKGGDIWWKFAAKLNDIIPVEVASKNAQEMTCKRDWEYILNYCKEAVNIIIWGFSQTGKEVLHYLQMSNIHTVRGFCDNNIKLLGEKYNGVEVIAIEKALTQFGNLLVINTSQKYYMEIDEQLLNLGIPKNQIVRYDKKNIYYYMALEKIYYKHEIKQIYLAEYGMIPEDLEISNFKARMPEEIIEKYGLDIWLN